MAADASQMPFIKNLASSDRKLRVQSLESLQTFAASRSTLSTTDALKLWKGLYYALWMTDRPLPQQALARDLAALLHRLRPSAADPWLRGFWAVLGAQWTDIDVLRMEKFLLLVRRVFAAQLAWTAVKGKGYDAKRVEVVVGVMRDWCFDAECDLRRVPVGLRLHVLDLWVDELEREGVLTEEGGVATGAEALVDEIKAMVDALRTCPVKPVRERARESFEDERLPWVEKEAEDEEMDGKAGADSDDESDGWGGIDD